MLELTPDIASQSNKFTARELCAWFTTDFINVTNKCLMFHYTWIRLRPYPTDIVYFNVYLQGEDRELELIREVRPPALPSEVSEFSNTDWITFFVALPTRPGFYQIAIQGSIGSSYSYFIDDLTVRPCYDFGE